MIARYASRVSRLNTNQKTRFYGVDMRDACVNSIGKRFITKNVTFQTQLDPMLRPTPGASCRCDSSIEKPLRFQMTQFLAKSDQCQGST